MARSVVVLLHLQPWPVAGRRHAVKHMSMELDNLKRVFRALDVCKDNVISSEEIEPWA